MNKKEIAFGYAMKMASRVFECFDEELAEENFIDTEDLSSQENVKAFFYAALNLLPLAIYERFADVGDQDLLSMNHLANRLILEFDRVK